MTEGLSGGVQGAGRRRWSAEERRRIVAESFEPGASVSVVARRHDINTNLLFTWRRRYHEEHRSGSRACSFVPVAVSPESKPLGRGGIIEIDLGKSVRLRVDGDVDEEALSRVLRALGR